MISNRITQQASSPENPDRLIFGKGEMADLIRSFDWSQTELGPVQEWSESLLSQVNSTLGLGSAAILCWGPEFITIYNDAYRPLLGTRHPEALGRPVREVWPEAWHLIRSDLDVVMRTGRATNKKEALIPILVHGAMEDHYFNYSFSPLYENGTVAGILNLADDVTQTVLARRKLHSATERLHEVLEATTDGVLSLDPEWCITYVNQRGKKITAPRGEIVGCNLWEMFPALTFEGSPYVEHYHRAMDERIASEFESYYPEPLNIWVIVQVRPAEDGVVLFFRDVTEENRTAEALLQTEKLAAVGRLAASISHEINNPLESITNLLYLARNTTDTAEIQEYLDLAERELRRVSVISTQTLRFYKQSTSPMEVFCQDLIEGVLSIHQGRLVNSRVHVEKRKRAARAVRCFEGEIRQVLSNLIGNAIDAMHPVGGRLLLRSRGGTNWKNGQKGLVLTVADTGMGMPAKVQKKVFEAFYTTKGIGGTGLGLWVSQEIVARHGGSLRVRSCQKEGRSGTVFTLFLPFDAASR